MMILEKRSDKDRGLVYCLSTPLTKNQPLKYIAKHRRFWVWFQIKMYIISILKDRKWKSIKVCMKSWGYNKMRIWIPLNGRIVSLYRFIILTKQGIHQRIQSGLLKYVRHMKSYPIPKNVHYMTSRDGREPFTGPLGDHQKAPIFPVTNPIQNLGLPTKQISETHRGNSRRTA